MLQVEDDRKTIFTAVLAETKYFQLSEEINNKNHGGKTKGSSDKSGNCTQFLFVPDVFQETINHTLKQ